VKMLTKGMATIGQARTAVNAIAPGYFATELTRRCRGREVLGLARGPHADGRWGDVEELVGAAIFLSSTLRVSSMATSSMSTAASPPASEGFAIVVMGVSGSGKTTVGVRLADALTAEFIDGDDLHTDAARAKMKSGHPLTDEDRWPWLDRIGAELRRASARSSPAPRCGAPTRPAARSGRAKTALRISGGDPEKCARASRAHRALHASLAGGQPVRRAGAAARRTCVITISARAELDAEYPRWPSACVGDGRAVRTRNK